jgi:hypothetical protein
MLSQYLLKKIEPRNMDVVLMRRGMAPCGLVTRVGEAANCTEAPVFASRLLRLRKRSYPKCSYFARALLFEVMTRSTPMRLSLLLACGLLNLALSGQLWLKVSQGTVLGS